MAYFLALPHDSHLFLVVDSPRESYLGENYATDIQFTVQLIQPLLFQFSTHYYPPSIHQVSIKYPLSIPLSILMH